VFTVYDFLPFGSIRSVSIPQAESDRSICVARVLHVIADTDFDSLKMRRNICNTRNTTKRLRGGAFPGLSS
jgi:hypothetical protein